MITLWRSVCNVINKPHIPKSGYIKVVQQYDFYILHSALKELRAEVSMMRK